MIKVEYDDKKDLIKINDWQKESDMQEILTLLMILWDEVVLSSKGTITDELLFKEMKALSKLRLGGKDEKEVFKEHYIKPSYTDLEQRIDKAIEYIDNWKTINCNRYMNFEDDKIEPFDLGKLRNILKGGDKE